VIDRASDLRLRNVEIDARLEMAAALRKLGDLAKALRTLEAARELAKIGIDRRREARCLLTMAAIHADQDNEAAANGLLESAEKALEDAPTPELQRELSSLRQRLGPGETGRSGLLGPRLRRD
jgi:tetratricopeptide (TPR) repeat protein